MEGRGLWALLAGAAIVVLFVVFVLFGAGGGDDGGSDTTTTSSPRRAKGRLPRWRKRLKGAARKSPRPRSTAVDGSDATGVAIFGRVKNSLALQVAAEGLEPPTRARSYTIWLAASPQKMLPLASTEVGEDGTHRRPGRSPGRSPRLPRQRNLPPDRDHPHRRIAAESLAGESDERKGRARPTPATKSSAAKSPARSSAPPIASKKQKKPGDIGASVQGSSLPGFMIPLGIEPAP